MAKNPNARVIRSSSKSKAGLFLTENSASLVGDSRHFVVCDEVGVTIKGPISLVADAMGRREGALFVGLNDFLGMLPSTMVTPIPQKIPFPPVFAVVGIASTLAFFMSLLV